MRLRKEDSPQQSTSGGAAPRNADARSGALHQDARVVPSPAAVPALQRAAGNGAVARMLG
ncbi:hypothetical protein G3I40_43425, partial [Streptomyces sp. SID14478]|nr:hypothetical protein [Streptomyces sp. SID14478]